MFFASFSDSFKYFHTADAFAALVHASIWSRHGIVRYNLLRSFRLFRLPNIRCITSILPYFCMYLSIQVQEDMEKNSIFQWLRSTGIHLVMYLAEFQRKAPQDHWRIWPLIFKRFLHIARLLWAHVVNIFGQYDPPSCVPCNQTAGFQYMVQIICWPSYDCICWWTEQKCKRELVPGRKEPVNWERGESCVEFWSLHKLYIN